MKLGQAAACREDILSEAVAKELRKLCDQAKGSHGTRSFYGILMEIHGFLKEAHGFLLEFHGILMEFHVFFVLMEFHEV